MSIAPTYSGPRVTLYRGDCRDVLAWIRFGAVISDPPYGIGHNSNHGASWQGTEIEGDDDEALRDWIVAEAKSREIPWAVFGSWKCSRPAGCRGVLVWDKGPAFGMGDLSFPWKMSWEEIYIGGDGWLGRRDEGVLRGHLQVSWESKGRRHPHQKPVSLMRDIVAKLPEGVVVCDPFAGSGSTIVACIKAGIPVIGIESDPRHYRTMERRAREAEPLLAFGA